MSKQTVGIWEKLEDSVKLCPHTLTELRSDCCALDRALTSPLPLLLELEEYTTHKHCQISGNHSQCHGRNTSCAFTHISFPYKNKLALCCLCYSSASYVACLCIRETTGRDKKTPRASFTKASRLPRCKIGQLDWKRHEANQA